MDGQAIDAEFVVVIVMGAAVVRFWMVVIQGEARSGLGGQVKVTA
jgi:hypothetical protein